MNKRAEFGSDLEQSAFWMPFTANRQFKKAPRLLARAEGMYYWTPDGRQVLDGTAGLWCVNAGHCRPKIVEAVKRQVATMDFAPTFQMGHPIVFEFADRLPPPPPPVSLSLPCAPGTCALPPRAQPHLFPAAPPPPPAVKASASA